VRYALDVAREQILSRRALLGTAIALGAAGPTGLILRPGVAATPASGPELPPGREPTARSAEGPFYSASAPFRAKLTPPLAAGVVLLVGGRVWGEDTRRPLAGALLDLWQADHEGRYDNEGFEHRARLVADETGAYEVETIHPGVYGAGPGQYRPSHIHYRIAHPGYRTLTTQLYFAGDPHLAGDPLVHDSLVIRLERVQASRGAYERGTFDIVLRRHPA
jgi:protocatechuate 3,4-dioxygenase beta subunit